MLWRGEYQTEILPDTPLPQISGICADIIFGLSNWGDLPSLDLWIKLLTKTQPRITNWVVLSHISEHEFLTNIDSYVKKSQRFKFTLSQIPADWSGGKIYAYVPGRQLLMLGVPTEEAWDQFESAIRVYPPPED